MRLKKHFKKLSFLDSFRAIHGKTVYGQTIHGRESRRDVIFIIVVCFFTLIVFLIPTGFENSGIQSNTVRCKANIIYVDNEYLIAIGPVKY